MVHAFTDNVCEKLCCEWKLLNSSGVSRAVVDDKVEKLEDDMLVEEVMESVVEDVRKVKAESMIDEATDSVVEAVDCRLGSKEVATVVKSALADNPAFSEDDMVTDTASSKDVARVADKCVAVEGAVSTGLEEALSALIMSAAFARKLGSHSCALESILSHLLCNSIHYGLQMCSWDHREDPCVDHPQILRAYANLGSVLAPQGR